MPEPSTLKLLPAGAVTVASFRGASILDVLTIQHVGRDLFDLVEGQKKKAVVLDFADVRFLSSQAFGILLALRRKCDALGTAVALCSIHPALVRVFELTNLNKMFKIYEQRDEAILSLGGTPPTVEKKGPATEPAP
jgi:anti-sigma B factor antagonist